MKEDLKPVQETKSLEELKQEYLQEEIDVLEGFEIEVLEERIAFAYAPCNCGGCGSCACDPTTTIAGC